jgi:hypothetical protein
MNKAPSPAQVARIAATLTREGLPPGASTRQAFELLELAEHGLVAQSAGASWESGIARCEAMQAARAGGKAAVYGEDVSTRGEPVPFERALDSCMPRMKIVDRMPTFRAWLADAEGLSTIEAGERIAEFRMHGIPRNIYQHFRLTFAGWRKARTSRGRKAAGAAGQAAKQAAEAKAGGKARKRPVSSPSPRKKTS